MMDAAREPAGAGIPWARALGEAAFAAVVAVALFAAGSTLRLRFNPAVLICPVPMVLVAIRQGVRVGVPMVGLAAAVVAAAHMPGAAALAFVLEIGVPALVLGLCLRHNVGLEWTVVLGAASLCAAFILGLGVRAGGLDGLGPAYQEVRTEIDGNLQDAQQFYESLGAQGDLAAGEAAGTLRVFAGRALPGLLAAGNLLAAAAISALAMVLAARTVGTGTPAFTWTLPEGMVWAFIGAGAAALAPWGPWRLLGLNALLVILALYFLQGLSIVGFFFRRLEFPWYIRWLAALVAVVWPPLTLLVVTGTIAVGVFDVWVAFRRLDAPRSSGTAR
ncbi:MAG TPA: DUF2232 domain-containing protein [Candidatus Sulfotelmatobacter sp.]|nr:DUF2232 domain-containing protein [Candidatus Sulfotelmatobacter sp.]